MRVGVLTGGGDAPGLNCVIRAVVRHGVADSRHGLRRVRRRLAWPADRGDACHWTSTAVRGILPRGGTILGSSRTNPLKQEDGLDAVRDTSPTLGVDALIAIGGEDTLGVAAKLYDAGVNVVGVPKTIDNDLAATDVTFGFDTAVQIATDAIDRLHTTAESHKRIAGARGHGAPRRLDRAALRHGRWRQHHLDPRAAVRHGRGRRLGQGALRAWVRADHRDRRGSGAQGRRDGARRTPRTDAFGHVRLSGIGDWLARELETAHRARGPDHGARVRPAWRDADRARPRPGNAVRHARRSMPSATATSARWSPCGATTSCSCRWRTPWPS